MGKSANSWEKNDLNSQFNWGKGAMEWYISLWGSGILILLSSFSSYKVQPEKLDLSVYDPWLIIIFLVFLVSFNAGPSILICRNSIIPVTPWSPRATHKEFQLSLLPMGMSLTQSSPCFLLHSFPPCSHVFNLCNTVNNFSYTFQHFLNFFLSSP